MQQKYCDHGLSVAVLRITRPILRARSSCGSGGKPRKASTLPSANSSMGVPSGLGSTQSMSGLRVEPDVGRHDRQIQVAARAAAPWMPTLLPLRSLMVRMGSCANSS